MSSQAFQVFKPLLSLLHIEHSALENFEALLALTNLVSGSDDEMRARLLREPGAFGLIEHYLFEESHEMLRRAAAECVCNLVLADKVGRLVYKRLLCFCCCFVLIEVLLY